MPQTQERGSGEHASLGPCAFPDCVNTRHGATYCTGHEKQQSLGRALAPLRPHHRVRDGMKFCEMCSRSLPLEMFHAKGASVHHRCRGCRGVELRAQTYGLTVDEARRMVATEACQCCGAEFESMKGTHIDHDHETGAVRGVICRRCNTALGCVNDDVEHLRQLVAYLQRSIP